MNFDKNEYLEIELEYNEIVALIRKYYQQTYPIKGCKVDIRAENVKDKLKEIDIFHYDKPFYNLIFRTTITGKIKDKEGNYCNYKEVLNEEGTKELVHDALASKFNFEDIKIGYSFYDNSNGGINVKISNIIGKANKKSLIKRKLR